MTRRSSVRAVTLVGAILIAGGASVPVAAAGVGSPSAPRASMVVLSALTPQSKPGDSVTFLAKVTPRAAGRVVILRRRQRGRFVGATQATTNRAGQAVLHLRFGRAGTVVLRASAEAMPGFRGAMSASVVVDVSSVTPYSLPAGVQLAAGATGATVLGLQQRLSALGYWLGTPNGTFDDATQQAVYALEKAAGINRSGIVGPQFVAELNKGVAPVPRSKSGYLIEIDLERDLLLFVNNGKLLDVLNTSTGGGYTYIQDGATAVATTPVGVFSIFRTVDGMVTDSLGQLWRPRFFVGGDAIHGDSYVPPIPVSHGCVRVSNEAIDWIWATNMAPVGAKVWVY